MVVRAAIALLILSGAYFMTRPNKNVRNNNPLNIRESADWTGEKSTNLDKEFEEFISPEYGFRAAYIILLQYLERGDNTIEKIITKWAPAAVDNNHTMAYINFVSDKTMIDPTDELYPTALPLVMFHMSKFEGGNGAFSYQQAIAGEALAIQEDFVIARLERLGFEVTA